MYRTNGDSNNNMSHSILRTYGPRTPQLSLENSSSVENQYMRDDRYFNLLYKPYDSSNHRINHLSNIDHFNATRSTMDLNRNENNMAWRSTLINFRIMDAKLARIQQDCEFIENELARVGLAARNDNRPKATECTSPDLNLIGTALTTTASSSPREHNRATPVGPDLALNSPPTTLSPDLRLRFHLSSILNGGRSAEVISPVPTERQTFEQELRRQMESNPGFVSRCNTRPYRCPVCLSCVRQRKPASTLCGHIFCSSCIKTALRATCKCPVCQRLLTAGQIFRIYI